MMNNDRRNFDTAGDSKRDNLTGIGFVRRRASIAKCAVSVGGMAVLLVISSSIGYSQAPRDQRPLRRLGERLRGGIQQRLSGSVLPGGAPSSPGVVPRPSATAPNVGNVDSLRSGNANIERDGVARTGGDAMSASASGVTRSFYNSPRNTTAANRSLPADDPAAPTDSSRPESLSTLERGRLGLVVESAPPRRTSEGTLRRTRGALVVGTEPGSGAEAAGFREGDLIVAIQGRMINDVDHLVRELRNLQPGEPVQIRFVRDGNLQTKASVVAGANGKLPQDVYAQVQSMQTETVLDADGGVSDTAVSTEPGQTRSSLGGLGRMMGNWLGGSSTTPGNASQTMPAPAITNRESADSEELPPPKPAASSTDSSADSQSILPRPERTSAQSRVSTEDLDQLEPAIEPSSATEDALPAPR